MKCFKVTTTPTPTPTPATQKQKQHKTTRMTNNDKQQQNTDVPVHRREKKKLKRFTLYCEILSPCAVIARDCGLFLMFQAQNQVTFLVLNT